MPPTTEPDLTTVREAAEYLASQPAGEMRPHQLAAFSGVDGALSPAERQQFSDTWRAVGSPAAPAPAPAPSAGAGAVVMVRAPYLSQRDSATSQGDRMCYSSTCAMAALALKPGCLAGRGQPDDQYLAIVQRHGDTTDVAAQVAALRDLGIRARFRQDGSLAQIPAQIRRGVTVPVGWLHKGPVSSPAGGGHWSLVVGWDPNKQQVIVHDPFGEADLPNGGYARLNSQWHPVAGREQRYSWKNWSPRWMADGPSTGWWLDLSVM